MTTLSCAQARLNAADPICSTATPVSPVGVSVTSRRALSQNHRHNRHQGDDSFINHSEVCHSFQHFTYLLELVCKKHIHTFFLKKNVTLFHVELKIILQRHSLSL